MNYYLTNNATNEQLELGFSGVKSRPPVGRGRVARAAWWFAHMRQVVDEAMDWGNPATPPPQQIWIPGANRELKV